MKIALLTIWHCYNYGAELQTYATVRALRELGHEVEVIDYRLNEKKKYNSFIKNLSLFLHDLAPVKLKFKHFWKKYIPSTKYYGSIHELVENPPQADLYLVGSDQVWNPQITGDKATVYFLTFVPQDKKCASYASSIGTEEWYGNNELTEIAKKSLSRFFGISCREEQGCKIIKKVFERETTAVLDPTLLHRAYPELIKKVRTKRTLAYYQLSNSPVLMNFAKKKALDFGLTFVDVNKQTYLTSTFGWNRRSVQQWIKAIAESSFVITHSFHGVAMCLLHHKQFVVVYENGNRISRIQNILRMLDLEDRLFTSIEDAEISDIWNNKIDYKQVDNLLNIKREISWNYLNQITNS